MHIHNIDGKCFIALAANIMGMYGISNKVHCSCLPKKINVVLLLAVCFTGRGDLSLTNAKYFKFETDWVHA